MDFPIAHLLSNDKSHAWLIEFFHGGELVSPSSGSKGYIVNDSRRAPLLQHKDKHTGQCSTALTGTVLARTHFKCSQVVPIVRGFLQATSTAHCQGNPTVTTRTCLNRATGPWPAAMPA